MNTLRTQYGIVALSALALSACATRGYVRDQVRKASATTSIEVVAARDSAIRAANATREREDSQLVARMHARVDSQIAAQVAALRNDIDALKRDFNARVTVIENSVTFAMPVQFDFNAADVRTNDRPALERFATIVKKYYPNSRITLEGFADPAGSNAYNQRLSQRRAESVRTELVNFGVAGGNLNVVGYGETRLVARAEKDQPGAEQNRRVVFAIETSGAPITAAMLMGQQ